MGGASKSFRRPEEDLSRKDVEFPVADVYYARRGGTDG